MDVFSLSFYNAVNSIEFFAEVLFFCCGVGVSGLPLPAQASDPSRLFGWRDYPGLRRFNQTGTYTYTINGGLFSPGLLFAWGATACGYPKLSRRPTVDGKF